MNKIWNYGPKAIIYIKTKEGTEMKCEMIYIYGDEECKEK